MWNTTATTTWTSCVEARLCEGWTAKLVDAVLSRQGGWRLQAKAPAEKPRKPRPKPAGGKSQEVQVEAHQSPRLLGYLDFQERPSLRLRRMAAECIS